MVQLMRSDSDNHFIKKVKLEESQQQDDDVRCLPNKRPRFDFNLDSSPKVFFFSFVCVMFITTFDSDSKFMIFFFVWNSVI